MSPDKNLLSDVLGFIGIPGECQRPAENGWVVTRYQRSKSGIVAGGCQGDELHLESVRRPIDVRRRPLMLVVWRASLVGIHRQANIWL
jgi:hypothetical protein